MKRMFCAVLTGVLLLFLFPVFSFAGAYEKEQEELWYEGIYESLPPDTRELFDGLGVDGIDPDTLIDVSAEKVFGLLRDLLLREARPPFAAVVPVLGLMLLCAVAASFSEGALGGLCETVGVLCVIYSVILSSCDIFSESLSSVLATKDFMLCLLPAFCGVLAFSGKTLSAAGFQSVMLAFSGSVSASLAASAPLLTAAGTSLAVSASINPFFDLSSVIKLLNKAVTSVLAFVSAVFVAVLGIRGGIAAAADTVGLKGLRFIIGSSVPVVGSALGDALNTLTAGLGLIGNTAGFFGIAAILLINLPALCRLLLWKASLCILSAAAQLLGNDRVRKFIEAVNGMYSVTLAVICFNMFVYVIGLIIVLTAGKEA